jgi:hypothetical protein
VGVVNTSSASSFTSLSCTELVEMIVRRAEATVQKHFGRYMF